MTPNRYCIICGNEIISDDPAVLFCTDHAGEAADRPAQAGSTILEPEKAQAVPDITAEWQPGQTILNTYQVIGKLGRGGMGLVYRVHHNQWNLDLAVKQPLSKILRTEQGKNNFIREAETWVDLGLHPHIATCYYVRTLEGIPHVFAEFLRGGTLEDWIQGERGNLYYGTPAEILGRILDIAIQFAWGIGYAHDKKLVHQDIKPQNVLMTPEGGVKVTDFGLVKAFRQTSGQFDDPESGLVSGGAYTPAYCSPEQVNREKLSLKTDIWSWALSILEMFTGGVCWLGGQLAEAALTSYLDREPEEHIPRMPASLADLLGRCFQSDPALRPTGMDEIVEGLTDIFQQVTGTAYPREVPKPTELRAGSLNNKALTYLDLGKPDQAELLLDEALSLDAVHPNAAYNLNLLKWQKGEIDDLTMVSRIKQVSETLSTAWPAAYLLGQVQFKRGALDLARESFAQVADHPEAERLLGLIDRLGPSSQRLKTYRHHVPGVNAIAMHPSGKFVLSAGGKSLILWDIASGKVVRTFKGHQEFINATAISPDGRWALSGSGMNIRGGRSPQPDNTLRLWDLQTGECIQTLAGHAHSVNAVAFCPDGRFAVSASGDKTVRYWDLEKGTCLAVMEGHTFGLQSITVSSDGRFAASGGGGSFMSLKDHTIRIWDLEQKRCLKTLEGHQAAVGGLAFTPDGTRLLSGSEDTTLKLWDVQSGDCLRTFNGHNDFVNAVAITSDGRFAVSGSGSSLSASRTVREDALRIWDLDTGSCLRTFEGHNKAVNGVCFTPDEKQVFSGSEDYTLGLWDVSVVLSNYNPPYSIVVPVSSEAAAQQAQTFTSQLGEIEASLRQEDYQEGRQKLLEIRSMPDYERDEAIQDLWFELRQHCSPGRITGAWLTRTFSGHTGEVNDLAFSPDGKTFVSASSDKTIKRWELSSGKCVRDFEGFKLRATCVAYSPDGRYILGGGSAQNAYLKLWDLTIEDPHHYYYRLGHSIGMHSNAVTTITFSPDSRLAFSGSEDTRIAVRNVATGTVLRRFRGHEMGVTSVAVSPDGSTLVSASGTIMSKISKKPTDFSVRIWDLSSGDCRHVLTEHTNYVKSVAFTPNGKKIISASDDKTLRIWDPETGECLQVISGSEFRFNDLAVSPCGNYAVTACGLGGKGNILQIWDLNSGECVRVLEGHTDVVNAVAFSPDGRYILSGSKDQTIRLWELDWALADYQPADWDEAARPFLEHFLTLHTPYAGPLPEDRSPDEAAISAALTHKGSPVWDENDFQALMQTLRNRGYGGLRSEGVQNKLLELSKKR